MKNYIKSKINTTFDRLTCIEFSHKNRARSYFIFQCSCGNKVTKDYAEVKRNSLSRHKQSCGCLRKEKLIDWKTKVGEKHQKVQLTQFLGKQNNNAYYEYSCECGNISKTTYQNFLRIESCGCQNVPFKKGQVHKNLEIIEVLNQGKSKVKCSTCGKEKILKNETIKNKSTNNCVCSTGYNIKSEKSSISKKYRRWLNSIKYRYHKETDIDFDFYKSLVLKDCSYCGKSASEEKPNGIDRINSDVGYFKENVASCCYTCNIMKSDLTLDEFVNQIKKVFERVVLNGWK